MNEPLWQDYHKHTSLSNVYTKDSPLIHLDYWNELKARYGDKPCCYTTVEHGWAGNYFKTYDDLEKFNKKNGTNIKFVFGYEAYWVKDRHTDDKSNCHMILLARNDNGRKALNKILSIANKDGYYYRPRLDLELIMSLPPDDVMITSACFERGTQILTQEGYKNIEDAHRGDVVLSHDGKWNKVVAPTHREYNGKMCNIKFEGCFENIKCTEDHLFPTVEKKHGRVTDVIVWKHAKDLSLNDRVLDAIDEQQENVDFIYVDEILEELRKDTVFLSKRKNKININKMPVDSLLLTTMGLFVAEGNYGVGDYSLSFTFHKKETHLIDIINQFSEKYLSKQVHIQRKKNSKAVTITINGKEICLLFKNFINGGAENKNVPLFIKKLPPYKQMYFLKGLFLGDGCFTKKGRVTFVTISKSLAYDTRDILERNGIKCGCRTIASKIDKNGVNHRTSYAIDVYGEDLCKYFNEFVNSNNKWEFNFSKRNSSKEVKEIDGVKYLVKRIRGKEEYHYNGTVFCLNVENAHSFRVDGVNVHNCVAYWNKYQDIDSITAQLASKFPYFYLEVQPHHTQQQADLNRHIIELSSQLNVPIIAGCDSHVIFESQMKDRDDLLESAHISYEDEDGWFMDFPTYDVLFSRFQQQGVLSDEQIKKAIDNTNVLMDFEDIVLDRSLKVPVVKSLRDKTQQERNDEFERIVWDEWEQQKWDINQDKYDEYIKAINSEVKEIEACNMADYFITTYYTMKNGQEKYDGILTPTGRGSGVSMYINKLLRFTKIDRINSPVEMYPERFLTKERVLESHTPPD